MWLEKTGVEHQGNNQTLRHTCLVKQMERDQSDNTGVLQQVT